MTAQEGDYSRFSVNVGGGWMRRTVEFTRPTLAQVTIFDPCWGYFGPAVIPANQLLGTYRSDGGARDVGGGLDVPLGVRPPLHGRHSGADIGL